MHPHTATGWLTKEGISIRPNNTGIPPDRLLEAVRLREDGWSWKKLGARYGCSHTAARRAILKHLALSEDPTDRVSREPEGGSLKRAPPMERWSQISARLATGRMRLR